MKLSSGVRKTCAMLILAMASCIWTSNLWSQEYSILNNTRHRIGFVYGYGYQGLLDVNYNYRINLYQFQYVYALHHRPGWGIDVFALPQFNTTKFVPLYNSDQEIHGIEFGLNAGLIIRKILFNDFGNIYIQGSSGPHYTSRTPSRQSSGFIFSNNLFLGVEIKLYEKIWLDLNIGVRHISNANLKDPNSGLNNIILGAGILIPVVKHDGFSR